MPPTALRMAVRRFPLPFEMLIGTVFRTYQQNSLHPIDLFPCHRSESSVAADCVLTHLDGDIVEIWRGWRPRQRRIDVECEWGAGSAIVRSYGFIASLCIPSACHTSYPT